MAIIVMEEMLGGLDEVKDALDRAITVLTDLWRSAIRHWSRICRRCSTAPCCNP